ncbi:MAG: carotenoid oxygenase family protein [Burkholderiales bacterium]|nr:carotenoid oxygenase family protein [Burkholderiales bacterium]
MSSAVENLIRAAVTQAVTRIAEYNRNHRKADGPNPYLTGIHAPMSAELTLTDLEVSGRIPPELDGSYVRNGPNPIKPPNPATHHWFVGTGMVHGLRLQGGRALGYRNRWIRGREVSEALGEPPAPGKRTEGFDAPNTNVVGHAGAIWAIVEAGGNPVRLDAELMTVAHDPFGGTLHHAFSAHPHLDPATGEQHAICYHARVHDTVWHVVVGADGRVRREEPIAVQDGPSIHDCMITPRYVVVLDLPVTFSTKTMLAGHSFPYRWNPQHQARVGLLPREGRGSETIWCEVDPCYVFHPANAFETEDGRVILDACVHDTMFDGAYEGPSSSRVPFERWTIDPVARRVERRVVDPAPQEFPRPNEQLIGRPYRYAYTLALPEGGNPAFLDAPQLYKHDLQTGRREVHDFGPDRVAGEFVFVPRAGAAAEDDGWLLGFVIDRARDRTELAILDAARFEAEPQARIAIPHRVPPGFHGNWIPAR